MAAHHLDGSQWIPFANIFWLVVNYHMNCRGQCFSENLFLNILFKYISRKFMHIHSINVVCWRQALSMHIAKVQKSASLRSVECPVSENKCWEGRMKCWSKLQCRKRYRTERLAMVLNSASHTMVPLGRAFLVDPAIQTLATVHPHSWSRPILPSCTLHTHNMSCKISLK